MTVHRRLPVPLVAQCFAVAVLSLGGVLLLTTAVSAAAGLSPRVVTSGSMAPVLRPGDVVLVAPVGDVRRVPVGAVLLVDDPTLQEGSYVHRVVRRDRAGVLVTRGDANLDEDDPPVTPGRVRGQVRLVVPLLGLPSLWVGDGRVFPLTLLTAAVGVSMLLLSLGKRRGRVHRAHGSISR